MSTSVNNKRVAVITGGGSGLGRALAKQYAQHGYAVVCADRNLAGANETVELIGGEAGSHLAYGIDVTDVAAMKQFVDAVYAKYAAVDVLINNAGVATAGSVFESSFEDWDWVIKINLMGVVYGCKLFGERMLAAKRGHIINTASFAALAGAPGLASYGTTKAAVYALSDGMRADLDGSAVNVSVVCPSFFRTNLMDGARATDPRFAKTALRLMDNARETADDIAREIYTQSNQGVFLIIPTKPEVWRWRIKRWLPNYYFKKLMQTMRATARGKNL